jgi:serine/threonine protein kinase
MQAELTVIAGPQKGAAFPLKTGDPLLIGRGKSTAAQLSDPHVSRVHCQVKIDGDQVIVTDLDSASGTYVNGKRITSQRLQAGDVVQIGETRLRLDRKDQMEEATLPPPSAKPASLPAERLQELTGSMILQYQLGPVLAKGQSGLVFKARDTKDNRDAALKVLWPEFAQDEDEVQRFIRAMKTMEYVEGPSLAQVLQKIGAGAALDWRLALRVAIHLSRALVFAHYHKIIHRNITPPNILIRGEDQLAKLGDLMMAKALEGKMAQQITRPGELLGDVRFLPPERTSGLATEVDARSDIYSLGATAYALLTGRPPHEGRSFVETILKIRQEVPAPPRTAQPALPGALEDIVLKMLAKQPEARHQTASEALTALEAFAKTVGMKV